MYSMEVRQKALALLATGLSLNRVSQQLGVSRSAVTSWCDEPMPRIRNVCPLPVAPSGQYAALLGFYLGDGCISQHPRAYALRIFCDARLPGIVADVERLLLFVHPGRPVHRMKAPGVVVLQSYWQHWPCLFPQHGPGRKHERKLELADWQREIVEDFPADFLRGLFHSDGCRITNWATKVVAGEKKRYEYPRWQFVNESADIMRWCGEALDLLGIAWRQTSRRQLSVSRREAVARLDVLLGPKS